MQVSKINKVVNKKLKIILEFDYCKPKKLSKFDKEPIFAHLEYRSDYTKTINYTEFKMMKGCLASGYIVTTIKKYKEPDQTTESRKFNCKGEWQYA